MDLEFASSVAGSRVSYSLERVIDEPGSKRVWGLEIGV